MREKDIIDMALVMVEERKILKANVDEMLMNKHLQPVLDSLSERGQLDIFWTEFVTVYRACWCLSFALFYPL